MATVKQPREAGPDRPGIGHTIRSWWMLMAEASVGEDLAIMAETGLTLPQVLTLFKLHDQSPQCVSSIAAVLHLSQPATSQLLDRLVHEGLVDRTEDPGDRRRKRLAITPRGARLVTRLAEAKSRGLDHAANRLSPQVRKRLASVLQEALRQLDRGSAGVTTPPGRKERNRHEL
ncbi:MAG: MarR family transcriptional regulator [Thermoanaerobaculaceae bacterium]